MLRTLLFPAADTTDSCFSFKRCLLVSAGSELEQAAKAHNVEP